MSGEATGHLMCMRVAITGASRTIGSVVVQGLRVEDAYGLACLARRRSEGPDSRGVDWRSVDFSTVACQDTLVGASTGAVVHSAWGFQLPHDPACLTELGIGGIRRMLRAVAETGVPHLVHKSSFGASSPKKDNRGVEQSWPAKGMPSSWHSRHKPVAERLLDQHAASGTGALVTRPWPGFAGQGGAGLLPALVCSVRPRTQQDARPAAGPAEGPRADYRNGSPDDVAVALRQRVADPFHLTADTPVSAAVIADALGARPVHVPLAAVRAVMPAAWHARLQQFETGWPGMAFRTARTRLPGWSGA
ncbi:NAD-dependent epimerase/dehydratase family protein [Streptomyces sp. B22F1]|uniref:NAD-dependent epimerase/dehydratase family protein n=1 Tax=Streptomyces sp. B22F1 TaxID=3153566 RepID=UPI00325EBB25